MIKKMAKAVQDDYHRSIWGQCIEKDEPPKGFEEESYDEFGDHHHHHHSEEHFDGPDLMHVVTHLDDDDTTSFVNLSKNGLEQGHGPVPVECDSVGQAYYLRSANGSLCSVFKPADEEPGTPSRRKVNSFVRRHGIPVGEGYVRELIAYLIDHDSFSGVPATALVRIYAKAWQRRDSGSTGSSVSLSPDNHFREIPNIPTHTNWKGLESSSSPSSSAVKDLFNTQRMGKAKKGLRQRTMSLSHEKKSVFTLSIDTQAGQIPKQTIDNLPFKLGSLQEYVSHHGSAEDVGHNLMTADMVQRIAVLDLRILNTDRHLGNILLQTVEHKNSATPDRRCRRAESEYSSSSFMRRGSSNSLKLVPIDHGLCLPKINELGSNAGETDADLINLEWLFFPQVREETLPHVKKYIDEIDVDHDIALIQATVPKFSIGHAELLTLRVCTAMLQEMTKLGCTLFEIGDAIQNGILKALVEAAGIPELMSDKNQVASFMDRFKSLLKSHECCCK